MPAKKTQPATRKAGCTRFDGASNKCQGQQVLLQPANKKFQEKKNKQSGSQKKKKLDKEELQNHELKNYQQKKKRRV